MKPLTLCAAVLATGLALGQVLADDQQGSIIVRIGAGRAGANDSSWLRLDGTRLANTRRHSAANESVTFTGAWLFSGHWGIGLLSGPAGQPAPEWMSPGGAGQPPSTLAMQWYPIHSGFPLQPYVGLGVSYTAIREKSAGSTTDHYFVAVPDAASGLDASWGMAGEVGVDISLGRNSRWLVNAAVWYLDTGTEARLPASRAGSRVDTRVDSDPWAYSVGIGYRF